MKVVLESEILQRLSARGKLVYLCMAMSRHGSRSTPQELALIGGVTVEAMEKCLLEAQSLQNLELKPQRKASERKQEPFVLPSWIPSQVWEGYVDARRHRHGAPTAYASRLIVDKLTKMRDEGQDPVAILNQSATQGWAGVFALRSEINHSQGVLSAALRLKPTEFKR